MGKGLFWGILLLVIAFICFLAASGMDNVNYSRQGAYCIAGFFVIAALPFFITAFVKYAGYRREATAGIQAQQPFQEPTLLKQQGQTPTSPQSSTRRQLFVPQALPEEQSKRSQKRSSER